MDVLFPFLVLLFIFLLIIALVAVVGHWLWLLGAWMFGRSGNVAPQEKSEPLQGCKQCGFGLPEHAKFCPRCGYHRPSVIQRELLKDLAATERQLHRFQRANLVDEATYNQLKTHIESERDRLMGKDGAKPPEPVSQSPITVPPPSVTTPPQEEVVTPAPEPVVTGSFIATEDEIIIEPVPTFLANEAERAAEEASVFSTAPSVAREPRRSFAEMLNAFMEESNIRWGEIVGGLLIIGCSTALVVSLWSEISQIPVLKFLIFTTVTAALFGVGLYTEHRWKLPTTSRGILTTATLLVPLNFLAIAAVSGGMESGGAAIIASELIAPAVFLCLVYFAGKVLTPSWPHLLVAGVLGSSVGQLLIRHFASPDISPALLVALGAFPLVCYVAAAVWILRKTLFDAEAKESIAIFITIGALTFAAVLPFALLIYKTGPIAMTMMYLAPLVSFGGFPALAIGLLLWRQFKDPDAVTTRTVGTALSILGTMIVVAGMVLAWPNPASIVPAALFNFAVFTALAIVLELPIAHVLASICFAHAYIVLVQVMTGHVSWLNLRETSLLSASLSTRSGLALAPLFIAYVLASEWFSKYRNDQEGRAYLIGASIVASVCLVLTTAYGVLFWAGPFQLWFAYGTCALGALWIGWRRQWTHCTWAGSVLLLVSLAQAFAVLPLQFPWQTATFTHATICAVAVLFLRRKTAVGSLIDPLRDSALIASAFAVITLVQASSWETTALQAQRVFWLAGIWLVLVWITRKTQLFILFQVALTLGVVLYIKATLQQYAWYAYLPHAFLHPWGLQIQGTVLVLLSLAWLALRQLENSKRFAGVFSDDARRLLNLPGSIDRIVLWSVLSGFVLLAVYGALPGITRELSAAAHSNPSWDIAGFPHDQALQIGSWILLALLLIAFLATFWQRRNSTYLLGAIVALVTACPLIAGTWEANTSTASAWRWCAALLLLLASLPLWFRTRLAPQVNSWGWPQDANQGLSRRVLELLLILIVVPLILLTLYPAVRAVYYMPVHGPSAGLFAQLDQRLSYALPLILVAVVVIGHGLRERVSEYVLAAGLLFNGAATIAFLFSVVAVGASMNRVVVAQALQVNAIVFALYALVWLAASRYSLDRDRSTLKKLLAIQVLLAVIANLLLIVPPSVLLSTRPEFISIGAVAVGSVTGWLALLLTTVAGIAAAKIFEVKLSPVSLLLLLLSISCLLACRFATASEYNWTPAHVYLIAITTTSWLLILARNFPQQLTETRLGINFRNDWGQSALMLAGLAGLFAGFLSLRLWGDDPSSKWWSIVPLFAVSVLYAVLNWFTYRRRFIYLGGIAFTAAALIWATVYYANSKEFFAFLSIHAIALALSSIVWLYLELRAQRLNEQTRWAFLSFHNVASVWALLLVGLIVLLRTLLHPDFSQIPRAGLIDWLALLSLAALLFACSWDRRAKHSVAALHLVGLLFIAQALDQLALDWNNLLWASVLAVAGYVALTSYIWRHRKSVLGYSSRWRIPSRIGETTTQLAWLVAFNLLLVAGVTFLAYWIVIANEEFSRRITAALAVAALAICFGLLAEGSNRRNWQRAAIVIFVLGLVFCGWSVLTPELTGTWFNRAVIMMVALFTLIAFYGAVLGKITEGKWDWPIALRDTVPWLAAAACTALLFSLATEVFYQVEFGAVNIAPLALFAIGATLTASIFISLLFALSPKHDPLGLSERGRMGYVYAAEVMLALLFMHVRLTLPWLFSGFFERYWPLVVMVIAYLGVATSESLRRRRLLVLAQPLERTGVFLPLLPVIGFWLAQSEVDYSALLFLVGGLYGLLSLLRRSFVFGLLAAIAGNGGLWYLWHRSADFQFLQHPQLWLIPVAVSALIAVYLNEDDFSPEQMASIRYLCLVTIYASSTADIFINGVAESPWLPLILAALSLAGVFGGIVFRIRGFLLLGSVFLLLSIITMIWYASANLGWTWLWYVAGIVTGATIIFMFAVFEKKRNEVLRVVEGLKEWQR